MSVISTSGIHFCDIQSNDDDDDLFDDVRLINDEDDEDTLLDVEVEEVLLGESICKIFSLSIGYSVQ